MNNVGRFIILVVLLLTSCDKEKNVESDLSLIYEISFTNYFYDSNTFYLLNGPEAAGGHAVLDFPSIVKNDITGEVYYITKLSYSETLEDISGKVLYSYPEENLSVPTKQMQDISNKSITEEISRTSFLAQIVINGHEKLAKFEIIRRTVNDLSGIPEKSRDVTRGVSKIKLTIIDSKDF